MCEGGGGRPAAEREEQENRRAAKQQGAQPGGLEMGLARMHLDGPNKKNRGDLKMAHP
jgi:hypothetical protein